MKKLKKQIRRYAAMLAAFLLCILISMPAAADETDNETVSENRSASEILAQSDTDASTEDEKEVSYDDLAGLKAAVKDGSIQDTVLEGLVKDPEIYYYKTLADECIALEQGKVDYVLAGQEQYSYLADAYDDITPIPQLSFPCGEVGYIFAKDEKSDALRSKIDAYIDEISESGELEEIHDYWFSAGEKETVELPSDGENGVLTLASTCESPPFIYIQDNKCTGFEAAILAGFCQEYGYGIRVETVDLSGILAAVTSGKCDLAAGSLMKTAEREEKVNFSKMTVRPMFTILMRNEDAEALAGVTNQNSSDNRNFFENVADSFRKTFITENRWQMIFQGCAVTLLLTMFASIIGIFLGLQIYKVRVCKNKALRKLIGIFNAIMGGTPMVVLLMIFYYIIFGMVPIPAFFVAVIAFGLNFSSSVSEIYYTCINSIDIGQTEAALALGYSQKQAFHRFILPQAMLRALPLIKGQIIALLKGTAIVGYISIQDLTKMGDIIRSRTYEAFFPLIAIAVIYFVFAWLIRVAISRVEIKIDPVKRRSRRLEKTEGKNDL